MPKATLEIQKPYTPVPYEAADVTAVQLMERGECTPELQKRFFNWLINGVCATYDQSFREDPYNTAFAEGRRFCGNTVVKMLKVDPAKVRSKENG